MPFNKKIAMILGIFFPLLIPGLFPNWVYGEDLLRAPNSLSRGKTQIVLNHDKTSITISKKIASSPVIFYRKFLSSYWGNTCSHFPSCSQYSLLAIKKHGFFIGLMMTFDRLQHESNEARYSPLVKLKGVTKVYDPVSNNDFWWYEKNGTQPDNQFEK
jgi:putative component of membrane protein insertase Oxa1/YidC/SpoIIIJ protein YidD